MRNSQTTSCFNKGFSFLDVVITVSILSMIVFVLAVFQKDIFILYSINRDSLDAELQGQNTLRSVIPEIREASLSSLGAYPIVQAATSSLIFFSDTDDDQLREQIRYFVDNGELKKGVITPSGDPLTYNPADETVKTIALNIANSTSTPIFEYYDTNYQGDSDPLPYPIDLILIRLVKINVVIDKDPYRPPGPVNFDSQVSIRNLKDNL